MIDNYLMGVVWDDNRANQTVQLIDATAAGRIGVRVVSGSDWNPRGEGRLLQPECCLPNEGGQNVEPGRDEGVRRALFVSE